MLAFLPCEGFKCSDAFEIRRGSVHEKLLPADELHIASTKEGIDRVAAQQQPFQAWRLSGPSAFALALICVLAALGWAWMAMGVAALLDLPGQADLGPGMAYFGLGGLADGLAPALVWCEQVFGIPVHGTRITGFAGFAVAFAMWAAMACGMMLPTAAPMVTTYGEIADTAKRGAHPIVSVLYLIAGYAAVWLAFSLAATLAQAVLYASGALTATLTPAIPWFGAGILFAAGAYQFSNAKMACLTACRSPFSFFFANWRDTPSGIFGLGLRQGFLCLGCCWALMLVMFAAGLMNLVWMALLGVIMLLEKTVPWPDAVRRLTGFGLLVWGAVMAGLAVTAM